MARDFENAKTRKDEIYYSRYIASWHRMGGKIFYDGLFEEWLREKEKLDEDEIDLIMLMATNGKCELENSIAEFLKTKETEIFDMEKTVEKPEG